MSLDHRYRSGSSSDSPARGASAALTPGKRTLTEGLPMQAPAAAGKAAATAPAAAPSLGMIAADSQLTRPGQLTQTVFLAQLRDAVSATASDVLGPTWSASSCADIQRMFSHYAALDPATCERIMQRYSGVTTPASALAYIAPICARIRGAISRWGGGEELSWNVGASGVPTALEGSGGGGASVTLGDLGTGGPLDGATAARMATAFGARFDDVQLHTDPAAADKTRALGADALAVGSHIAFASGQYQPGTPSGDGLIAHELAHVLQQRGSAPLVQRRAAGVASSGAHEHDADQAASAVVARLHPDTAGGAATADTGAPIRPALTTSLGVHRGNKPEAPKKPSQPPRQQAPQLQPQPQLQPPPQQVLPPPLPPPWQAQRLYPEVPVPDEDDDRVAKNGFNYMVGQLQQVGQRIGAPPHPLTNQSVINATQAIVGAMGGGGGDYGIKCKATVPQVVQAAYDAGYHIDDDDVRGAIRGVATQLAAMGGTTQIGSYKGDWRGGGFFDYDKK